MSKRILWTGIVASVLLCFLFSSNATAARMELTLGWHNLGEKGSGDDFYLIANDFGEGEQIKSGKLKGSSLAEPSVVNFKNLGLESTEVAWDVAVANFKKINKFTAKITEKALKKAAKNWTKNEKGTKKGWKTQFEFYNTGHAWTHYGNDLFVSDAFNALFDKKMIKANIGGGKYKLKLVAFANPIDGMSTTQVPEPGTMFLFGIGLLGTALVGRKIKKS